MGLSGPRKKAKLSHDPNNTAWSRSETGFGHKLLKAQGWAPGDNLGAKNSPHAHLHTAASSSHIKVTLRDDNLGIGAKKGSGQDAGQCTGLDAFQGLLGRLNGKSEDTLKKEQDSRNVIQNILYTERRWGTMRFVSGGILEGTKVERLEELACSSAVQVNEGGRTAKAMDNKSQTSSSNSTSATTPHTGQAHDAPSSKEENKQGRKGRKENKARKNQKRKPSENSPAGPEFESPDELALQPNSPPTSDAADPIEETHSRESRKKEKAKRRAEKAQRKLERQQRRAAKAAALVQKQDPHSSASTSNDKADGHEVAVSVTQVAPVKVAVVPGNARHAVRQRYVQQKRMAIMDSKALNEIFMIKAK